MMDGTYEDDLADFRQNDLDSGVPRSLVQLSCGMHCTSLETREFYVHMINHSTHHSSAVLCKHVKATGFTKGFAFEN